jgi:hypothetical protein
LKKLVLAALVGLFAFGAVAGMSTAQAAPDRLHCTGVNSVWDDSDIVNLTKQGAGTLELSWTARGRTTLQCGSGSPLTNQTARIEQRIHARVTPNGAIHGQGQTRLVLGNRDIVIPGHYRGTTTINDGNLSVSGDFVGKKVIDGGDLVIWQLRMHTHGTVNVASKSFTNHVIDSVVFDTSTQR